MTSFNLSIKGYLDQKTDDVTTKQLEDFLKEELSELGYDDLEVKLEETETK